MAWWHRLGRTLRPDRATSEIDEELASHLQEALDNGRDPAEARRAFGDLVRQRERSRDAKLMGWLDALRADGRFGWRQIRKNWVTSAGAILSLGLAMGACVGAFRIVDAMLLRPLPISHPERLFVLVREGFDGPGASFHRDDTSEYPLFARMRDRVRDRADLVAISPAFESDVFYGSSPDAEKAYRQFVSGSLFHVLGVGPALGRVFTSADDGAPGASPYAVISYDYWTRRFAREPAVLGRTVRIGGQTFEIVGVTPEGFTGTEPGVSPDIFVPAVMAPPVGREDSSWIRTFVMLHGGVTIDEVLPRLRVEFQSTQETRAKGFVGMSPEYLRAFLGRTLIASAAFNGVSGLQRRYTRALGAVAVFVGVVLLIACVNIASLRTAQAAARSREMALRVSIGAGRGRLVQLMLVESAILAAAAAVVGAVVAAWSAPFVVSHLNPPASVIRLALPVDWRVTLFGTALTLGVVLLFGLVPALRTSATSPIDSLKTGDRASVHARQLYAPVVVQVAFCALVLLLGGLFVKSFNRLTSQSTGFSAERIVTLDTVAAPSQLPVSWDQLAADVRATPGVDTVAYAFWALLTGIRSTGFIWRSGRPTTQTLAQFLPVSPGWIGAMKIPLLAGRDFRDADRSPGAAIVNDAFVREFFDGRNPIGQTFERQLGTAARPQYEVVGVVGNARYDDVRDPIAPTVYIPFASVGPAGTLRPIAEATLVVRSAQGDPLVLVPELRRIIRARTPFRVTEVASQQAIDDAQTVRERLLAMLAWFFSAVALALTAIGIYGVLYYTVQQRQREIGVCRAIGASAMDVTRRVTGRLAIALGLGATIGIALGCGAAGWLATLFYDTRATDLNQLATPLVAILGVAALAALVPIVRALRVDPAVVLRAD